MLNDHLYTITDFKSENGKAEAAINIDANHKIFEGHFPGQPVLPGVCMVQIAKELMEKAIEKKLFMYKADSCKFLSMVDPRISPNLQFIIDYTFTEEGINTIAVLKNNDAVFLKMNCSYRIS